MLRKDEIKKMAIELREIQEAKKKCLTLQEIADIYGLSSRTLARLRVNKMIHQNLAEKIGIHYHIKETAE